MIPGKKKQRADIKWIEQKIFLKNTHIEIIQKEIKSLQQDLKKTKSIKYNKSDPIYCPNCKRLFRVEAQWIKTK